MKPLRFIDSSQKDLRQMPDTVRQAFGCGPLQTTHESIEMNVHDIAITESSGNVFLDLGFEPAEAEVMKMRAEVMIRTAQHLNEQGWTQAEAARKLGVTQPRVSRLLKGKVEDFSLDMLLTLAARAGLHAELRLNA